MRTDYLSTLKNRKALFSYIFASALLLYFIFSPALNTLFYALDDYRYAFGGIHKACRTDDGFEFMLTLGRPIQAYLDCLNYKFGFTFERMRIVRYISIFLLAGAMGLLMDWFITLGFSLGVAFFAAGSFCLVPNMHIDAILTGSQPLVLAIILVLLSYRSINHFHHCQLEIPPSHIKERWLMLSGMLLLGALLTYPAMGFFFVTLMLTKVLFTRSFSWRQTKSEIKLETILFLSTCVIYFLYAYLNMHFFPQAPVTDPAYHVDHPNFNVVEILGRIAYLANVFNPLWTLSPLVTINGQAWFIIILMTGGAICCLSNTFVHHKHINKQIIIVVLGLCLLSSGFFLIMPSRVVEPRLLIGTITAGIALLLWSAVQWTLLFSEHHRKNILFAMVVGFFLFQGYHTNIAMTSAALSYNQYLADTKIIIANYIHSGNSLRRIHYVVPKNSYPYDKFFLTNGALLQILGRDNYRLQWCSLSRGTPGAEQDHQAEAITCVHTQPKDTIAITYTYPEEKFVKTNDMLLIDAHDMSVANITKEKQERYFNIH